MRAPIQVNCRRTRHHSINTMAVRPKTAATHGPCERSSSHSAPIGTPTQSAAVMPALSRPPHVMSRFGSQSFFLSSFPTPLTPQLHATLPFSLPFLRAETLPFAMTSVYIHGTLPDIRTPVRDRSRLPCHPPSDDRHTISTPRLPRHLSIDIPIRGSVQETKRMQANTGIYYDTTKIQEGVTVDQNK